MHLTPAEYVIRVFKGVRRTARLIGRNPSSVSKWLSSKTRDGIQGHIPGPAQHLILAKARELNLDITPEDLVVGRQIKSKRDLEKLTPLFQRGGARSAS